MSSQTERSIKRMCKQSDSTSVETFLIWSRLHSLINLRHWGENKTYKSLLGREAVMSAFLLTDLMSHFRIRSASLCLKVLLVSFRGGFSSQRGNDAAQWSTEQTSFNNNAVPGLFQHQSVKCSVFTFNVVAMVRIRYNFRPPLPVERVTWVH